MEGQSFGDRSGFCFHDTKPSNAGAGGKSQLLNGVNMKQISFIRSMIFLMLVVGVVAAACRKTFLAQRPSSDLLVPNSLNVLQELLDNTNVMNISPALGELSADNYYFLYDTWAG